MPNKTNLTALIEQRVSCDVGEFIKNTPGRTTITNIIKTSERGRFVLPANSFAQLNKTIRLKVWGSKSGVGLKTIHFSVVKNKTFDKYQALDSIPLGSTDCHFYFETVVTALSSNTQSVNSIFLPDSGIATVNNKTTKIKFKDERIFRIYGECSDKSDVITINKYEMYICG